MADSGLSRTTSKSLADAKVGAVTRRIFRSAGRGFVLFMIAVAPIASFSMSAAFGMGAAAKTKRCGSYGSAWSTLASNTQVRVYTRTRLPRDWRKKDELQQRVFAEKRFGPVYACLRGSKAARIPVDDPDGDRLDDITRALPRYAVSGKYFAYYYSVLPWDVLDLYGIQRLDVESGDTEAITLKGQDHYANCKSPVPSGIQVTNRGTVAYMSCDAAGIPIVVIKDAAGERVLDQSPEIVVGSLRRVGPSLRWTHGSELRTAEIR